MDKEAENYLKVEREISLFRSESLRAALYRGSASTKRLLAIEEEFCQIPFELITNNVAELLCAIDIFRNSRTSFYETYPICRRIDRLDTSALPRLCILLKNKIILMQDDCDNLSAKNARHLGRLIVILVAILSCLESTICRLHELKINIDHKELIKEISIRYESDIYSEYNKIILQINSLDYISDDCKQIISNTKQLINIISGPSDGFYAIESGKVKSKNIFGFFIQSRHSGRETLKPYYHHLIDEDGYDISSLFANDVRSILNSNNEYYKFIPVIDLKSIQHNLLILDKYNLFIKRVFDKKLNILPSIRLNTDKSIILVPSSRTEDEGIKEASIAASAIFQKLIITVIS